MKNWSTFQSEITIPRGYEELYLSILKTHLFIFVHDSFWSHKLVVKNFKRIYRSFKYMFYKKIKKNVLTTLVFDNLYLRTVLLCSKKVSRFTISIVRNPRRESDPLLAGFFHSSTLNRKRRFEYMWI